MKTRRFVTRFAFLSLGLMLTFISQRASAAAPNLLLDIQGPFVLCESGTYLLVAIPNLDGNHYTPGFVVDRSDDFAMGIPVAGGDLRYPTYTQYKLEFNSGGNGTMTPIADGNGNPTSNLPTLYREKDTCDDTAIKTYASVVVQIPKPDRITPLGGQSGAVTDKKPSDIHTPVGNALGPCKDMGGCLHANVVELEYDGVDLASMKLTCVSGQCQTTPTTPWPEPWMFDVTYGPARLQYNAQAIIQKANGADSSAASIPKDCKQLVAGSGSVLERMALEEAEAFCASTAMAGRPRYITHPHMMIKNSGGSMKSFIVSASHQNCKAAIALFCKNGVICQ